MTEIQIQLIASFKIVWLAIFSLLYGLGGMYGTPIRRFGASSFITLGIYLFSYLTGTFNWWLGLYAPLLGLSLSLGYGADKLRSKILKRSYCGAAYGIAAIPIAIITQQWVMFGVHMALCMAISIIFGVLNPVHARTEETTIACAIGLMPLLMV